MSTTLLLQQPCPFHFSFPRIHIPHTFTTSISIKPITKQPHNTIKCHLNHKNPSSLSSNSKSKSPLESLAKTIWNTLRKPAVAAILIGVLLISDPNTALAASGGRMGGRSFSSSSSSSSSRSYSVPSSPSRGFSSYSAPYYGPSPFSGGVYFGPAVGFGAGSSFFLILVGFAAFVLVSGFLSDRSDGSVLTAAGKTTVLKLQNGFSFPKHRIHIPHTFTPPMAISITKPHKTIIKYHLDCKSPSTSSLSSNSKTPLESLANTIWNALRKSAVAAILIGFLLMYVPNTALAASGGRMGGSSFSKSKSKSSSSSSTSYSSRSSSVPTSKSSSSSSSSSPSSSSYSSRKSSSSSSSYSSRSSSVPTSKSLSSSSSSPSYSSSSSPSSSSSSSPDSEPSTFNSGVYFSPTSNFRSLEPSQFSSFCNLVFWVALILVCGYISYHCGRYEGSTTVTVLKYQVGLLGMGRSLQRDLNRIAEVADTSSPEGLSYILSETSLALLRHPDYCISGYSSVDIKRGIEDGEKHFNKLSIEERGKFDEETLVNVNNIKRQSTRSQRSNGFSNEYIVITILVAAEGETKIPSINGSGNLKEALQKLGSIPSSKLLAVEVLWTPQNENDTLSERELLEDYPLLRPL
ncbi:myelin-associated oligodendrocyte basic protein [Trifolium repens]|nr:myelin-associated oligodendrocyte basic protein [Trifolium repens]